MQRPCALWPYVVTADAPERTLVRQLTRVHRLDVAIAECGVVRTARIGFHVERRLLVRGIVGRLQRVLSAIDGCRRRLARVSCHVEVAERQGSARIAAA